MDADERLRHYLTDIYSIEQQALAQLRTAPEIAGGGELSRHFADHLAETEEQAEAIRSRLEAVGGSPSRVKDAVMRLGGKGFLLFARSQPDTPGKLCAHAHSYEALELASYELLMLAARDAGDADTERVAREIRDQEAAMRDRLAGSFDEAASLSLKKIGREPADALPSYLADAHALEQQSISLLKRAEDLGGPDELQRRYLGHQHESEEHARLVESALSEMADEVSTIKDAALRLGAVNWAIFFKALKDTPAKLAAFVYAVEHLEIAGYELLRRVAHAAGNSEVINLCDSIVGSERAMADDVLRALGRTFSLTIREQA